MPPNVAANPFYVQPAMADISPVLQGIGSIIKRNRDEKQRISRSDEINTAIQSGDPAQIAQMSIKYPEMSKQISDSFGFTNDLTKQISIDTYSRVLSDPENALDYMTKGIERVSAAGGTPDAMVQDTQMLQSDPESGLKRINAAFAMFDGKSWQDIQAGKNKLSKKAFQPITLINPVTKEKRLVAPTVDPNTGKAELSPFAIPEGFEVSKETAEEKRAANIIAKGEGKAAEITGKNIAQRRQSMIDKGLEAADSFANVKRGLTLLDRMETGGIDAMALRAKQLFGVEGADEAELSNRLGKAVLSQLKSTFGAAFTVEEGKRLERLEAGFGKSTKGNRRILEQAKKMILRSARRGIKAAKKSGDLETAEEIQQALDFVIEDAPDQTAVTSVAQNPSEGATATNPQTGQRITFINGQWQ